MLKWRMKASCHASFLSPPTGATRNVARESVVFGAGESGGEFIDFAKLEHVGRGFDLNSTQHWLASVPEAFFEWHAVWRSR